MNWHSRKSQNISQPTMSLICMLVSALLLFGLLWLIETPATFILFAETILMAAYISALVYDFFRKRSYYNLLLKMTEQMEEIWAFLENHILSSDNPLQALEHSEMNTIIMKKVEELPAKCRAIFKASLYEGKTYSEIAEEQNINVTTVRVQMKIALTKLRESLGTPYMIAILMFL